MKVLAEHLPYKNCDRYLRHKGYNEWKKIKMFEYINIIFNSFILQIFMLPWLWLVYLVTNRNIKIKKAMCLT